MIDLQEIRARLKLNRIIAKDQVYVQDVTDFLGYIEKLEAVAEAANEATHHDYITPELWQALARLDGDRHET